MKAKEGEGRAHRQQPCGRRRAAREQAGISLGERLLLLLAMAILQDSAGCHPPAAADATSFAPATIAFQRCMPWPQPKHQQHHELWRLQQRKWAKAAVTCVSMSIRAAPANFAAARSRGNSREGF